MSALSGRAASLPVDESLRRNLKLAPPARPTGRLAVGGGRLGVAGEHELVVYDLHRFDAKQFPIPGITQVAALADGSLLALGDTGLHRLGAHQGALRSFPRPTAFPGSQMLPDRADPNRLWVSHAFGDALYGYELAAETDGVAVSAARSHGLLAPEKVITLDGYAQGAFSSLRDGSYLYVAADGYRRFFAGGKPRTLLGDSKSVFRVLAFERLDRVWIVRDDGAVQLAQMTAKVAPLFTVEGAGTPLAAAAAGRSLAVLYLRQPDDAPKRFAVIVFGADGKRRLERSLPASPSATEDWAQELLSNAAIALSQEPPRVLVGGPDRLAAWDTASGELLLATGSFEGAQPPR